MEGLQEYEFSVIIVNQYSGALTLCKALRYTTELLSSRNLHSYYPHFIDEETVTQKD